jgi:hypothetical protein
MHQRLRKCCDEASEKFESAIRLKCYSPKQPEHNCAGNAQPCSRHCDLSPLSAAHMVHVQQPEKREMSVISAQYLLSIRCSVVFFFCS